MWRRRNFICDPADLVLWSADATLIRSPGAAIASFWVLVAGLLAGCSTSDGVGLFIVDPGHYSVYHCDGLAARLKVLLAREQEIGRAKAAASRSETSRIASTMRTPWARRRSYGARRRRRNATCPRPPNPCHPLQRRTWRSQRQLPHRFFEAIRPSAEQPCWRNSIGFQMPASDVQFKFLPSSFKSWFREFW